MSVEAHSAPPNGRFDRMIHHRIVAFACIALSLALAACGGSGKPSISAPEENSRTLQLEFPPGGVVEHQLPFRIPGGVPPFKSSIDGCPDWVTLFPDQGILAGSAPVEDHGRTFFCTYFITDSAFVGGRTLSHGLRLVIGSSKAADSLSLPQLSKVHLAVGTFYSEELPVAAGGVPPYVYSFTCVGGVLPSGMGFGPETRVFAGTPDARFRDSCTYTATDRSQPTKTVSKAVEVEVSSRASTLSLPSPEKLSLTVGTYHVAALPAATGGVGPYTYSFTCAGGQLPSGLGSTARSSGAPTLSASSPTRTPSHASSAPCYSSRTTNGPSEGGT